MKQLNKWEAKYFQTFSFLQRSEVGGGGAGSKEVEVRSVLWMLLLNF